MPNTTSSPPIRIAIAGAGLIGRAHMDALKHAPNSTLSALVDPSDAAQALADQARVPLYRSLAELLAHDRPDAVVIATPNAMHVPQAMACMDAGLPVLLEKPVATTVAEAEGLLRFVEQRGATVLVGHHRAHSAIMAKAREVVASGQLGRVVAVMGSATFYKPDHYFTDAPWRREPGGGPILINMIHEVHNLRMLCGEIKAVQAFQSNAVRGFAVEDTVAINLRFANGALGTFMLSDTAASARSWEQTSGENKSYAHCDDEDCYTVSGTQGSLSVPTMRMKYYANGAPRSWWEPFQTNAIALVRDDPIQQQMAHFVKVVRGEAQPLVSVRDGLNNLRVTEAITEATRTGSVVELQGT